MEQYWMPKKLDRKNLRLCIDNYKAERLYIRLVGSMGGTVKVNESLEGKTLGFKKDKSGLFLLVDSNEVFHFPLKRYDKGFSVAYERIEPTDDGIGRMIMLSTGEDPYDAKLPEPRRSFLRNVLDEHLIEIFFKGRIHLKFHSWWQEPHWKYWTAVKPPS
ncbi:MAG: hypothetical protein QME12_03620 [Nanoarchaeota archaeon]|nr:hypothetical protein [Nanoarchaeota archaeon]